MGCDPLIKPRKRTRTRIVHHTPPLAVAQMASSQVHRHRCGHCYDNGEETTLDLSDVHTNLPPTHDAESVSVGSAACSKGKLDAGKE